jgi:hypothetical protein
MNTDAPSPLSITLRLAPGTTYADIARAESQFNMAHFALKILPEGHSLQLISETSARDRQGRLMSAGALMRVANQLASDLPVTGLIWDASGVEMNLEAFAALLSIYDDDSEPPVSFLVQLTLVEPDAISPDYLVRTKGLSTLVGYEIEAKPRVRSGINHHGKLALRLARDVLKNGDIPHQIEVNGLTDKEKVTINPAFSLRDSKERVLTINSSHY